MKTDLNNQPLASMQGRTGLSPVEPVGVGPEFIRLPKAGTRDPIASLGRSALNALILPTEENNFRPPVKSFCLRKRGAQRGIRLISVDSLRAYILSHESIQE